jgi:hypothetical protein
MATITVGQENNTDIDLYYEDHGTGQSGLSPTIGAASGLRAGPRSATTTTRLPQI